MSDPFSSVINADATSGGLTEKVRGELRRREGANRQEVSLVARVGAI